MLTLDGKEIKVSPRMPPQDLEAERSVLGSLMLDSKAINVVIDILKSDDFYHQKNQFIFRAMCDLYENKEPIDVLSVSSRLKEKKILEEIGGNSYLTDLVNCVPTASNVKHYAEIVRKKSVLRGLIESSEEISQLGYKEDQDIDLLLDSAEQKIFGLARYSGKQRFLNIKEPISEAWERFNKLSESSGELRGISTGFSGLDNHLAGLQKSDLIILAARPAMGKTTLALDIARNVAKHNIPVGVFSLEMSIHQLVDRLLAAEAMVDSWKLRTGKIRDDRDFTLIRDAMDRLSNAPLFIDDEASNNILQMRAKARRLQAEHGLGLLIVDYIQLMVPRFSSDNPVQQMTEISRSLKSLARELEVPVLAVSSFPGLLSQGLIKNRNFTICAIREVLNRTRTW